MRIGIIGTNWGRMHIGGFRGAGAEVSALCGKDPHKTTRIAHEEGVPMATTDVGQLVESVDAVVVAGPDGLHATHVLAALERRRPVLSEKPLARTLEEAERLVAAAANARVLCAVNFPYRQLPPFAALKRWLAGRTVRRAVVNIRNGFGPEPQAASGPVTGASGDFGGMSHALDALMWLTGARPEPVQASAQGRPIHSAMIQLGDGAGGRFGLNQVLCPEPGIHGAWSLIGDDWEVGFDAGYVPARGGWCIAPVRLFEHGSWRDLAPGDEPHPGRPEPWAQAHVATAKAFLEAVRGEGKGTLASFEDGRNVQRVFAQVAATSA